MANAYYSYGEKPREERPKGSTMLKFFVDRNDVTLSGIIKKIQRDLTIDDSNQLLSFSEAQMMEAQVNQKTGKLMIKETIQDKAVKKQNRIPFFIKIHY